MWGALLVIVLPGPDTSCTHMSTYYHMHRSASGVKTPFHMAGPMYMLKFVKDAEQARGASPRLAVYPCARSPRSCSRCAAASPRRRRSSRSAANVAHSL